MKKSARKKRDNRNAKEDDNDDGHLIMTIDGVLVY